VSSSKLPSTSNTCLSWDSFECAPHPTSSARVHSQQRCRCLRPSSANWSTRSVLVVSHHLDGLLRARSSGLVASRYRKGFAAFPHRAAACRPAFRRRPARIRTVTAFSRCALHTPRRSPPNCSRSASLRPLPPRRCACALHMNKFTLQTSTLDLEALLHCWVRSACHPLPVDLRPLLPWASFPSRVLGE